MVVLGTGVVALLVGRGGGVVVGGMVEEEDNFVGPVCFLGCPTRSLAKTGLG